jgi:hypothetical protein
MNGNIVSIKILTGSDAKSNVARKGIYGEGLARHVGRLTTTLITYTLIDRCKIDIRTAVGIQEIHLVAWHINVTIEG